MDHAAVACQAPPVSAIPVVLRLLSREDVQELASWGADERFCAHADWSVDLSEEWATRWWQDQVSSAPADLIRLAAVSEQRVVGYVDLHGDDPVERELGFVIGPSAHWGQGFGFAAAQAGLEYGFTVLGLQRIWAEALEANVASIRVLQRLGMDSTGPRESALFLGQPSRYRGFQLLRAQWTARHTD